MKMHIDFSLMSETEAFGYVDGEIELPFVPRAGDHISFGRGKVPPWPWVKGMMDFVKVECAILRPNSEEISLNRADIIVSTRDDARNFAEYLERNFGLFFNEFDPGESKGTS